MEYWEYLILFLSVIGGGSLAFYVKKNNQSMLQSVLSFSGAYILGISVLHLMPTVFTGMVENVGLWVLGGFFIQLVLEQFSGGVEHGHVHAPHHAKGQFAIQVMIGLCLHAFMEGMPLSGYGEIHEALTGHDHSHNHLLWGIILHKAPAAFALVLLFNMSGFKKKLVVFCLFFFAMMSPLGAASTSFLDSHGWLDPYKMTIIMAIVVGSFLHIATTILFEVDSSKHHHISIPKMVAILLGLGMAVMTVH